MVKLMFVLNAELERTPNKVAEDHEAKIVAADRTNTLLASLVTLADELRVLAQEGKDINLDPVAYASLLIL